MTEQARGAALLVSVLLWAPVLPSFLRGGTSAEEALLLYAASLALSVVGCSLLAALVRAYTPVQEPVPVEVEEEHERRRGDLAA